MHDDDYDVVWYRRPSKPILPDYIHPDDVENVKRENLALYNGMWSVVFSKAFWINPALSAHNANSKLLQLKLASNVKLKIPETLISNDPKLIKDFINKNTSIFKTIYPALWATDDSLHLTYTSTITTDELPSDKILQCSPGIFQQKIEKQYELRITYFGSKYIAVKIDSQKFNESKNDWRSAPIEQLLLEQVTLPAEIDLACRSLMNKLGIVFGCFDFIVTPNNDYYFLEVNEQGQFLWIEGINPEIKMLESFIEFVSNSSIKFSFLDLRKEATKYMHAAMKYHVNPKLF